MRLLATLFLAAALLARGSDASAAAPGVATPQPDGDRCKPKSYPEGALKRSEQGLVVLAVLVGADGRPLDSKIRSSSGSRALDRATMLAYAKCTYKPGSLNGAPARMWASFDYLWELAPGDGKPAETLAQAAADGDLKARFGLALLLTRHDRTAVEWRQGMELLLDAADRGLPLAQVTLATMYEGGDRVPMDIEKARHWFTLAAAQGDEVAKDHLRFIGGSP
jgi:TonB family protein